MPIRDMLLPEFEQEVAGARRTLERVPDDRLDWSPHAKSGTMGWLAGHLANVPSWCALTLRDNKLDVAPGGTPMPQPPLPKSSAELVATLDRHAAEAREALSAVSDEDLAQPWTLLQNGQELLTMPKLVVLRQFVFNHLVHHRAQLGVYLRLNDVPVPAIYGPSADENPL